MHLSIPYGSLFISILTFPNPISQWLLGKAFAPLLQNTHYNDRPHLTLNTKNAFRIAVFSDLHYGEEENGWGIDADVKSTNVMHKILDFDPPDLVVINGDLITGENTFLANSTKYVDQIVKPMLDRHIPWASTYGNHDSQFNLSREALFEEETKHKLSYTLHGTKGKKGGGVTNYYLPIYPSKGKGLKPAAILWFFDSQGGFPFQKSPEDEVLPDWVEESVVRWFRTTSTKLQSKWGILPSIAFVHIPPTGFLKFQQKVLPHPLQVDPHYPGLNDDVPVNPQAQSGNGDDTAFTQALRDLPGLNSVYSGHDHGDSWCGNWPGAHGPHLCFCKHTGYGGYGEWKRGARFVDIHFGRENEAEVRTWIRMEAGGVVQSVSLNATYGSDVYPIEDGED